MALSLGVSVGERISVGGSILEVRTIKSPHLMVVAVNDGPDINVTSDKTGAVEILPGVRLFIGIGKNGNQNRLAFDALKSVPIHLLGKEKQQPELKVSPHKYKQNGTTVRSEALFINGVFEEPLEEILNNQKDYPDKVHYLQPHSGSRILLLAKSTFTPETKITLFLSLTKTLNLVSYRAKIVGWHDKRKLDKKVLATLNEHVQQFQLSEGEIYLTMPNGNQCVNLISIVDLKRVEHPFSVSCLTKTVDEKPLHNRERSGGWVVVQDPPYWLGAVSEVLQEQVDHELAVGVARSQKDTSASRQQRLAQAPKQPESIQVLSLAYRRNPDVIAEVLYRANGVCEGCHAQAPFERASDNTPYLEVHHRVWLSQGGEDTVANALALCPNCHRKLHYGNYED